MKILIVGAGSYVAKSLFSCCNEEDALFVDRSWAFEAKAGKTFIDDIIDDFDRIFYFLGKMKGSERDLIEANCGLLTDVVQHLVRCGYPGHFFYVSTLGAIFEPFLSSNAYLKSKRLAESVVNLSKLQSTVVRFSFPVGCGESSDRMLSSICNKIIRNLPVNLDNFIFRPTLLSIHAEHIRNRLMSSPGMESINFIPNLDVSLIEFAREFKIGYKSNSLIHINDQFIDFSRDLASTIPIHKDESMDYLVDEYLKCFKERGSK